MANSLRRGPLGRNPFEAAILTPGPLGHNDAASPFTPSWFVGNTPGTVGINDHADPGLPRTYKVTVNEAKGVLPIAMSISQQGLDFIWAEEYVEGISERLHWPGGASGVTLGAGYDMKARTKEGIATDLVRIGIAADIAEKVAEGAGLVAQDANSFVRNNRKLITIKSFQATELLKLIIKGYESIVQHRVKVPLLQHEYDALVCFAYNPGGRFRKVGDFINSGLVDKAMKEIKAANTSGGKILTGLVKRRDHEVDLFLNGKYQP